MNAKRSLLRLLRTVLTLIAGLLLPWTGFAAARPEALLTTANPRVLEVIDVQEAATPGLMAMEDILGTAVGLDADGQVAMIVYVNLEGRSFGQAMRAVPKVIGQVRVVAEPTDPFRALAGKPGGGGGVSHTSKQAPPIQLGTSGGWRYDLANGYCCGGTLGSLIQINDVQHILSNYHVLEADIVDGGNGRVATTDDPVTQPGLIDVSCNAANAQDVATLVKRSSLPGSNVDAAVARVMPGMVRADGAILEIGTISAETAPAFINQTVKKSGRTTGLTRSTISGLNATVSVAYDNECAGGAAFTKTYTGQIVIKNSLPRGKKFIAGGDSGSLMVEDVTISPRAVGLLFAGSSTSAIANPIDEVLGFFGATMVGN